MFIEFTEPCKSIHFSYFAILQCILIGFYMIAILNDVKFHIIKKERMTVRENELFFKRQKSSSKLSPITKAFYKVWMAK